MKRYYLFIFLFSAIIPWAGGQAVEVRADSEKINGIRYQGFSSKITADEYDLESALKRNLRSLGKMRERNTYYSITRVTLDGIEYVDRDFYAVLKRSDIVQTVWMGVDTTGLVGGAWGNLMGSLESHLYTFVLEFYRSLVQEDIDESKQAEAYMIKKQGRLEKNQRDLEDELLKNEQELIDLQEAIKANKLRHEVLLKNIADNEAEQDSTINSLQTIREVLQLHESRKDSIR